MKSKSDAGRDETPRVLIFVVAYNAAKTLVDLLDRVPVADMPGTTEVLVIDDSSSDATFDLAVEYEWGGPELPMTVLCTPVNVGYGGNQKLGYQYAIEHGFDHVALLHGDGQYPPELLPDLLAPLLSDSADAVFGSRMMEPWRALRDGMPAYKYVGNKILTRFQNAVLGTRFTEFHSGYRAYSVRALSHIPFEHNTDDFHFDTEIIIQLLLHRKRIVEMPIPTYYGDEICHVNGLRYARDVFAATLLARLQEWGLLYRRRFDSLQPSASPYQSKLTIDSSHSMAFAAVPRGAQVLDVGCGPGHLAAALIAERGCRVTGVDLEPPEQLAESSQFRALQADLDAGLPEEALGSYDVILALDVVEHLRSPEDFLDDLRRRFGRDRPRVILTVPNIAFVVTRLALFLGIFNYGRRGILDRTHTRLFTRSSLRALLLEAGFRIDALRGVPAPFALALGAGRLAAVLASINRWLIGLVPGLFSYQLYAEAEMVPTVEQLLGETLVTSEERRQPADASSSAALAAEHCAERGEGARSPRRETEPHRWAAPPVRTPS